MEKLIRHFFWKGGKQNDKRFSLINWEIVIKQTLEGGPNLKDLKAQNLAMEAKLIWKIIAPNPNWAQITLWRKYFRGMRLRCLDQPKNTFKTHFSSFINIIAPMIKNHSHWILGNGKCIQLWSDRILDRPPLEESRDFTTLRTWLAAANIHTLWDISMWTEDSWAGWKQLSVPNVLQTEWTTLRSHLHRLAPIHTCRKDARGWGKK